MYVFCIFQKRRLNSTEEVIQVAAVLDIWNSALNETDKELTDILKPDLEQLSRESQSKKLQIWCTAVIYVLQKKHIPK